MLLELGEHDAGGGQMRSVSFVRSLGFFVLRWCVGGSWVLFCEDLKEEKKRSKKIPLYLRRERREKTMTTHGEDDHHHHGDDLESYFASKLKAKDEELRRSVLAQSEAEQNAFYAVSKLAEMRENFKIEKALWKEKAERAFMITDDVDREKWKEALIKFDSFDLREDGTCERKNTHLNSLESVSALRFEFQSTLMLLKKTKEEYLRMEKMLSEMEQDNRKLRLKLKESNDVLKSIRDGELSDVKKQCESLRRENLTVSQECAEANAHSSAMKAEMMKWKRAAETLMKEEEILKSNIFDNVENDENVMNNRLGGKKMKMRAMELSLEKALVAKEELEKDVKRLGEEVQKEKEEKARALKREEIASAALAACSVPFSSSKTNATTTTTQTSTQTQNNVRLSAASHIAELEKKIEKLEHRNEMLMETLEKSDYEYAREVALIQAEHERMLAVVSGGRLV